MTYIYHSAPFGASEDESLLNYGGEGSLKSVGPVVVDNRPQQQQPQKKEQKQQQHIKEQIQKSYIEKEIALRQCQSASKLPIWAKILLWVLTLLLIPVLAWGVVSIMYVNKLSNGLTAAQKELNDLNEQIAERTLLLQEANEFKQI